MTYVYIKLEVRKYIIASMSTATKEACLGDYMKIGILWGSSLALLVGG